jgi:FkbM family methyltransferase
MSSPAVTSAKRFIESLLLNVPSAYAGLLEAAGRGSLEKRLFLRIMRPGWTVLDVGANRGIFTRLFSSLSGANGAVHAFEPIPATADLLVQSLSARQQRRISLNRCAVGDHEGTVEIFMPGNDHGQTSLRQHSMGSWNGAPVVTTFAVPMTTLDAYVERQAIRRVDFIKIDVEGAELLVLGGARKLLARDTPLLFAEVCRTWLEGFGATPEQMILLLLDAGYDRFVWQGDDGLQTIDTAAVRAGSRLPFTDLSANILCGRGTLHRRLFDTI